MKNLIFVAAISCLSLSGIAFAGNFTKVYVCENQDVEEFHVLKLIKKSKKSGELHFFTRAMESRELALEEYESEALPVISVGLSHIRIPAKGGGNIPGKKKPSSIFRGVMGIGGITGIEFILPNDWGAAIQLRRHYRLKSGVEVDGENETITTSFNCNVVD